MSRLLKEIFKVIGNCNCNGYVQGNGKANRNGNAQGNIYGNDKGDSSGHVHGNGVGFGLNGNV